MPAAAGAGGGCVAAPPNHHAERRPPTRPGGALALAGIARGDQPRGHAARWRSGVSRGMDAAGRIDDRWLYRGWDAWARGNRTQTLDGSLTYVGTIFRTDPIRRRARCL